MWPFSSSASTSTSTLTSTSSSSGKSSLSSSQEEPLQPPSNRPVEPPPASSSSSLSPSSSALQPQSSPLASLATGQIRAPGADPKSDAAKRGDVWKDGSVNFGANASMRTLKGTAMASSALTSAACALSVYRLQSPLDVGGRVLFGSVQVLFPFFALREYVITPLLTGESWQTECKYSVNQPERPEMTHLLLDSFLAGEVTAVGAAIIRKKPIPPALIGFGIVTLSSQLFMNGIRLWNWNPNARTDTAHSTLVTTRNWDESARDVSLYDHPDVKAAKEKQLQDQGLAIPDHPDSQSYLQPLPEYKSDPKAQTTSWFGKLIQYGDFIRKMSDEDVLVSVRKELQALHKEKQALEQERAQLEERKVAVAELVAKQAADRPPRPQLI